MIKGIREGTAKELPVLIKADVQGSAEALAGALGRLGTEKVITRSSTAASAASAKPT
jgi:translation initiation factor IF-2